MENGCAVFLCVIGICLLILSIHPGQLISKQNKVKFCFLDIVVKQLALDRLLLIFCFCVALFTFFVIFLNKTSAYSPAQKWRH